VIDKPPSAELRPGQKDTDSLPDYDVLDPIIEGYVEGDESVAELAARGINIELARRVARMVDLNEYKRRQAPPGVRVSRKAFGKDRRPPITNRWPADQARDLRRMADAAAVVAGARVDHGDDHVRGDVQDRARRARTRDTGWIHPAAFHRGDDRAASVRVAA
jgi:hypothetical protein